MYLSDLLAAFRWWLALLVVGAAAAPLNAYLFRRLADRGYAFAKMSGLLVVSYLFWVLGSLGLLGNDIGGILFALVTLLVLSFWANRVAQGEPWHWLQRHWSQIVVTELLFALIFVFWVWVRAQNPAIAATEKPMEFAFLNAVGRSSVFPPQDPWLSGFGISYYYFGYVMSSLIARISVVAEPVAFNLAIAWLVAGTATAAFGLVYNLVAVRGTRRGALVLALIAALALPIAGNLEIGLELLHGRGIGSAEFWHWLDVRDLNGPVAAGETARYESSSWWWWRSSRVIHEYHLSGQAEEGLEPIAEFPGFSFVLGDMHPHVLALPFAFLSLAVAFSWWLGDEDRDHLTEMIAWDEAKWPKRFQMLIAQIGRPMWLFSALLLGGLSFLNTWDVLIHLFVVMSAFILHQWQRQGWHQQLLSQAAAVVAGLAVPAVLCYLPFYLGFRSQASAPYLLPMLMRPTRLAHYLVIFGMPVGTLSTLLLALAVQQRFRYWRQGITGVAAVLAGLVLLMLLLSWIVASNADGAWQVTTLANQLGIDLPARPAGLIAPVWGISAVMAILPAVISARLTYPWLTLFLAGFLCLVIMSWLRHFDSGPGSISKGADSHRKQARPPERSALPFVLLLVATGTLLTLGPEFVYLRDNFGVRLNTIFKFYYQAWVMFGVSALYALYYLAQELKVRARWLVTWVPITGYAITLLISLFFPLHAIRSRAAEYRGPANAEIRQPATLDGLAQLNRYNPDEYQAIMWLRENVQGTPVILEAVGGQYSNFARVSADTGLPTLLGWAGHELQWRGSANPEPGLRDPIVHRIYSQTDWRDTSALLDKYQVEYIYLGSLELSSYGPQIDANFADRLQVAFRNNSVTIYKWR